MILTPNCPLLYHMVYVLPNVPFSSFTIRCMAIAPHSSFHHILYGYLMVSVLHMRPLFSFFLTTIWSYIRCQNISPPYAVRSSHGLLSQSSALNLVFSADSDPCRRRSKTRHTLLFLLRASTSTPCLGPFPIAYHFVASLIY